MNDRSIKFEEKYQTPNGIGVLGDGFLHAGKYNMRLVGRAIREDWPIPPELRAMLVEQMGKIVDKGKNNRDKIAASKVLVSADTVNVKREALDIQADAPVNMPMVGINVSNGIGGSGVVASEPTGPRVVIYLPDNGREAKASPINAGTANVVDIEI